MSLSHSRWAWEQGERHKLETSDRLVLLYLSDQANGDGEHWCNRGRIQRFTGLPLSTIYRALARLATVGLIKLGWRHRCRLYVLQTEARANGLDPHPTTPKKAHRHRSPRPVTSVTMTDYPIEHPIEEEERRPPLSPVGTGDVCVPSAFEIFWATYPRKVGRRTAERAFNAAVNRGNSPDAILAGLHNASFPDDPRFIPHPTTWLRGDRWLDEVDSFDPVLRAAGFTPESLAAWRGRLQ